MKKISLIIFCVLSILLTGCSDTDNDGIQELTIPSPGVTETTDETNGLGGFDVLPESPWHSAP